MKEEPTVTVPILVSDARQLLSVLTEYLRGAPDPTSEQACRRIGKAVQEELRGHS